jgi:integrase
LGNIKLKDLNPGHIQHLINLKRDDGLGPWTLSFIRQVLNTSLQQAVSWGMISSNPGKMVKVPRIPKKEMHVWTKDQVKTFLNSLSGSRLEALYYMAVTTGLRQGELLGLLWSDVDWENKRIHLCRQLRRVREKGLQFEELKTVASRRTIYLGNSGVLNLNQHQEHQKTMIQKAGSKWNYRDIIFPSTIGTPLSPRNLYRHFIETTQKNQLPKIRFHDLRHTAATLMLNEGVHPKVVQERLGHSSISITLDVYSHVLPSMQEIVSEKLDNLLK